MIKIQAENQQSLKESQTEAAARAEAQSENVKVRKHIAAIRGHKAGEFVTEGMMKHGERIIESGVQIFTDFEEGKDDATESLVKAGKSVGALVKETAGVFSDNWEKVKEDFRNGKIHQKARWWMLSREGAAAAFDHRIAEQNRALDNLDYRKQTEARKFRELQAKFKNGEMSERDIERSMSEHLVEFEKEEEKARVEKERVEKEKKEHEQKVQELKNRVNERITKAINDIKLETNYDFNKEKQGNLKEQIEKGEAQLAKNKKEHKDLEARCKLIYGEGWLSASWLRKKLNLTRSESKVLGDFSAKQAEKMTAEQKADFAKAKGDLKKTMEGEKMSFENVARETKDCLAEHVIEIARLEKNLKKLRALKDPIDKVVVKAEGRMNKFEGERKSFGIAEKIDGLADEEVGEQVEVKSFANVTESKDYKDKLIGKEVVDLNSKIKSPAAWFGKAGALNFKVSGYENHSNAQRNQEVLLKIREEADSMSFKLEKAATKLRSTLKSKDTKKEDKPEFEKHLKEVTDKIEELKINILDRIPVDRDGNIEEDVDQEAVLRILCPDIFTISKNKKEVFGNELKTDEEKVEALKTLQDAIAEIDALPSPLARLKAYTKTISFMLDSKLRVDFADSDAKKDNTKAIDDIYLSIFSEKIPQLFSEISNPEVAVQEGLFENNIDLENQDNLVGLIDMLSKDSFDRNTSRLIEGYAKKAMENVSGDFDKTLDLMAHWADKDNDLYVSVKAGALKMANKDFDKLIKLADVMNKHDITLGLHATIDEAEMIARESFEKNLKSRGFEIDSTFSELEKVAEMFKSVKNLEGEGERIEAEINEIKNKESVNKTDDLELLNENVFKENDNTDFTSLSPDSEYSGNTDFIGNSIDSSFPGSIDNPDANFAGGSAKKPQKKKGLFASFFSSLFGGGSQ